MGFWGAVLTPWDEAPYRAPAGLEVHLFQVCLDPEARSGTFSYVMATRCGTRFALAALRRDGQESSALNVLLRGETTISIVGNAAVHVTGVITLVQEPTSPPSLSPESVPMT